MHRPDARDATGRHALHGTDPQRHIWIHGILHQHGDVHTSQAHRPLPAPRRDWQWCARRSKGCRYQPSKPLPHGLALATSTVTGMLCFQLNPLEPLQPDAANAFKTARPCARLPDARPEYVCPDVLESAWAVCHHLLLGLCTARPGYEQRAVWWRPWAKHRVCSIPFSFEPHLSQFLPSLPCLQTYV
jgi:hypothetical protein